MKEKKECMGRKWKQKFEEKEARFVDERLETLIPCIAQKIEAQKNGKKIEINEDKTKHDVKCTGCGVSPIYGIRYKCHECPNFNFC